MIFHNIYTMTIGQYMAMDESDNPNLIKNVNIWLPKSVIKKAKAELDLSFNKMLNGDEIIQMLSDSVHKTSMLVRIDNLTLSLYNALRLDFNLTGKITEDKELLFAYKEICNRELTCEDDIEYILSKRKLLINKYKELYPEKESAPETIKLTRIVQLLEMGMPHKIDRNSKLYELAGFMQIAKEKRLKDA